MQVRQAPVSDSNPEAPVPAQLEARNVLAWQTIVGGVASELTFRQAKKSPSCSYPQSPVLSRLKGCYRVVPDRLGVSFVKEGKPDTVEAYQTSRGSKPEVAISGLGDGRDCVLWQPILGLPNLMDILAERFMAI
jgi:hypothetical protein